MSNPFLLKLWEYVQWSLLEPLSDIHLWTALGLTLGLGLWVLRKTADAFEASRATYPMAFISVALGGGLLVLTLALLDMFALKSIPASVPTWAIFASGAGVMLLAVVVPLTKFLLKAGYGTSLSAWVSALVVGAVVVFVASFAFGLLGVKVGKLVSFKGGVTYRKSAEKDWGKPVGDAKVLLPIGGEVSTQPDGEATLDLGADSYLGLRGGTIVRVKAVGEEAMVEVDQGRVLGKVRHSAKTKFQLRTPAAITGILGTQFLVSTDANKNTSVTVADGSVAVSGTAPGSRTVTVAKGQSVAVPAGGQPGNPVPADPRLLQEITAFDSALANEVQKRNRTIEENL